jgi:THO complex subunit 4
MKIEIVVDPSKPPPLSARVGPAPAAASKPAASTRGRRPGRGKGPRKAERTPKTAADLDAEMEDYTASNAPAAAA